MEILPLKTPILQAKCDLLTAISEATIKNKQKLQEGDILVITSKVVALSQGRIVKLSDIKAGTRAKSLKKSRYGAGREDARIVELVLREADVTLPGAMLLTLQDGVLIPEAGIDRSNVPSEYAVLWPKNPMKTAGNLWKSIRAQFKLKKLGVVISDSHCSPLRWGTTGVAIGWAGFEGVQDVRGTKDLYGKALQVTKKAVADNLASAAALVMGEGGESVPFALVRRAPVKFVNRTGKVTDFFVKPADCIFGGIYNRSVFKKL